MDPENGDLGLEQRVKNTGQQPFKGHLWMRTLCRSGGFLVVPVQKSRRLPAGWALGKPGSQELESSRPQSENVSVKNGILVARGTGPATRLSIETDAGWIAYVTGRTLFIQYFPVEPRSQSLNSPAAEVHFDLAALELRLFGPELTLQPGAQSVVPAKWTLEGLEKDVNTPEQARSLASKIPPSPFRR